MKGSDVMNNPIHALIIAGGLLLWLIFVIVHHFVTREKMTGPWDVYR